MPMKIRLICCWNQTACLTSNPRTISRNNITKWNLLLFINITNFQILLVRRSSFSKNEKWKIKPAWAAGIRRANTIHLREQVRKCIKVYRNLGRKTLKRRKTYISLHLDKVLQLIKYTRGKWKQLT